MKVIKEWHNVPGFAPWRIYETDTGLRSWVILGPDGEPLEGCDWISPELLYPTDALFRLPLEIPPTIDRTAPQGDTLELVGKCRYGKPKALTTAPRTMAHEKLRDQAVATVKRWVSANYREWPYCVWGGEVKLYVVERTLDPDEGAMWVGVFECNKCSC